MPGALPWHGLDVVALIRHCCSFYCCIALDVCEQLLTGMSLVIQMPNVQPLNVTATQEMHDYLDSPNRCSGLLKDVAFVQQNWQTSKTLFRLL